MLYYMCKESGLPPTWPQLEHAIKRNFGGLESDEWNPFAEFKREINVDEKLPDVPQEVDKLIGTISMHDLGLFFQKLRIINPDCTELGLIRTSLGSSEQMWQEYVCNCTSTVKDLLHCYVQGKSLCSVLD